MSQENVQIVRAAYQAINEADDEALLRLCTGDVEVQASRLMLDQAGTFRGHEGAREYAASLREVWGNTLRSSPERFIEHEDSVVVMAHSSATASASGVTIDARYSHVWTIRAGKIARFQTFASHAQALEAVGLRE